MIDFGSYKALSFDCYGTLIDWETGILEALKSVLARHDIELPSKDVLELYADLESQIEKGPYLQYKNVLREVVRMMGECLAFEPMPGELDCLIDSLGRWKPFPDTVEALKSFKKHYGLAIISNIDNDLFAQSAPTLGVKFDWVITAEEVGEYKPSLENFEKAVERLRITPSRILHVAQSLYHDIIPAKQMGFTAVWVNRRKTKKGFGATPAARAKPDLEVQDLRSLVKIMDIS